jgi:hypothetical protein
MALLAWDAAPADTVLTMRLSIGGRPLYEASHTIEREENEGRGAGPGNDHIGFVFPMFWEGGWPAGTYTVEILYNGVPDEVAGFSVGGRPPPGSVIGSGSHTGTIGYADPSEVLVVTNSAVLRRQLRARADEVLAAAGRVGTILDLAAAGVPRTNPEAAATEVRKQLGTGIYRYLLIVGNHDAVPFFLLSNPVAGEDQQGNLPLEVPSDDPYSDLDGDPYGVPDFATARIPSSDDADLLLTQLGEVTVPDGGGFAYVNQERRSQAGAVIEEMTDHVGVEVQYAPPVDPARFAAGSADDARYLYVLMHGDGTDTTTWWADVESWTPTSADRFETEWDVESTTMDPAISIDTAPTSSGLVNVGACFGAWTIDLTGPPEHKTASNSLALHYLKSGTRAFVADTHISYSSQLYADGILRGRTGFEVAFWTAVDQGVAPIDAFLDAKQQMAAAIPQLRAIGHVDSALVAEKTVHYMVFLGRP